MDAIWWTLLLVGITFYTLWAARALKRKKADPDEQERRG